jgi:Ca-activated chloride channel family protein
MIASKTSRRPHTLLLALSSASLALMLSPAGADDPPAPTPPPQCDSDAMLVFDGSGSMAGNERLGIGSVVTRIDKVRKALDQVLPAVTPNRRIGLVTYGPGPYNRCDNIELNVKPVENAASTIKSVVDAIVPAGRTPLTEAVRLAAETLEFRKKPGVIVLLTDGEETCGGNPCTLAKELKSQAAGLTVHVIGYRMKDFSWTGGAGLMDMRCLAEATGGYYESPETVEELVQSLSKTLGCPELTLQRPPSTVRFAAKPSDACPLTRVR